LFFSISFNYLFPKAFLSLLAILWNFAFSWVYLSLSALPEEQWMEVRGIVHEAVTKTILKKEQWQEGKMVV